MVLLFGCATLIIVVIGVMLLLPKEGIPNITNPIVRDTTSKTEDVGQDNEPIIVDDPILKVELLFSDYPVKSEADKNSLKGLVNSNLTYDIVASDPEKFIGQVIQWGGRVFVEPEIDNEGVYLQIFSSDNDKSFITAYLDKSFAIEIDDYVVVTGIVVGEFDGTNAFGASLSSPLIKAGLIEKTTRAQALSPAKHIVNVGSTKSQNGFVVTLDRIEFADKETRFYLSLKNQSNDKVTFYTAFGAKAVQGSTQYEASYEYNNDEELVSELLPQITDSGCIIFDAMDYDLKQVKLYLDKPYSDDWGKDWDEVVFDITY